MTWHCYDIRRGHEIKAHSALVAAGYESLLVHEVTEIRGRDRKSRRAVVLSSRKEPLLVGYALIRAPADDQSWRLAIGRLSYYGGPNMGRLPLVRAYRGPVISGAAGLDRSAADGGLLARPGPARLKPGDRVRVIDGPFAAQTPIVIEDVTKKGARITIGSITVVAPFEALEAA